MSHPPILLFDFDGVIITQKALEFTALRLIKNKFYKWKNIKNMRLIDFARLFEESDSKNRLKALIRVYKVYKKYIPSRWRRILFFLKFRRMYPKYEKYEILKPNLENILFKLRQSNFPLGIVSNTSGKRLNSYRTKLGLDQYFSVFISRDNTPQRKPSPIPLLLALKHIKRDFNIQINKKDVYFVGDLPADVQSANNAGIKSIALLSGHGKKNDLEKTNPTFLIENIEDILEIEPLKKFL
ncbi:MAG: HAD family hydrolase [Candidatus Heimdallarchaeota archaeon]